MNRLLSILILGLFSSGVPLQAQMGTPLYRLHVPFAFSVHKSHLPAGDYTMSYSESARAWELRHAAHVDVELKGKSVRMMAAATRTSLEFIELDGRYALRSIQAAGSSVETIWPVSQAEGIGLLSRAKWPR